MFSSIVMRDRRVQGDAKVDDKHKKVDNMQTIVLKRLVM